MVSQGCHEAGEVGGSMAEKEYGRLRRMYGATETQKSLCLTEWGDDGGQRGQSAGERAAVREGRTKGTGAKFCRGGGNGRTIGRGDE